MKIPCVKNIKDFFYDIHKKSCHKSFDKLRLDIMNKKIYYKGIIKDLKAVINNCTIYIIKRAKIDIKKKSLIN